VIDQRILQLNNEGLSASKIAKIVGRHQTYVSKQLKIHGIVNKFTYGPGRKKIPRPCNLCGKPKEKLKNKYCHECFSKQLHRHKQNADEYGDSTTRRKHLIRVRGHQCENCKRKTWMGMEIPLQTHHIDGNADNNNENNLKLLCPNCHTLTPNYSGKNMGTNSSRNAYRKKYRKEVSEYAI
jgi:hypothetical protein